MKCRGQVTVIPKSICRRRREKYKMGGPWGSVGMGVQSVLDDATTMTDRHLGLTYLYASAYSANDQANDLATMAHLTARMMVSMPILFAHLNWSFFCFQFSTFRRHYSRNNENIICHSDPEGASPGLSNIQFLILTQST